MTLWPLYVIGAGLLLTPLPGLALVVGLGVWLSRRPGLLGIARREWLLLVVISFFSVLAVVLVRLFNYYHWQAGNAFLDQFDPDIDLLKMTNVFAACFGLGFAFELWRIGGRRTAVLGFLCAFPGCASIFIYG